MSPQINAIKMYKGTGVGVEALVTMLGACKALSWVIFDRPGNGAMGRMAAIY